MTASSVMVSTRSQIEQHDKEKGRKDSVTYQLEAAIKTAMGNLREFHKGLPNENKDDFLFDVPFSAKKSFFIKMRMYKQ